MEVDRSVRTRCRIVLRSVIGSNIQNLGSEL
jgi:hypothetical protein